MTRLQTAERTNRPLTCRIRDAADESLVGGKARNLSRLMALGLPVPDGFVLTNAVFDTFLDANALRDRIDQLSHALDPTDLATLHDRACAIGLLVRNAAIPDEIRELIDQLPDGLMRDTVLVARSSAVGEDSERASFAGQLDSVLGLETTADLRHAVLTCWESYWSERALFYRAARAAGLDGMAVIVQRQVAARVSGVLFTRAPAGLPGAGPDDLAIEYCAGLGDGLVSGRVDPGRLIVSRGDLAVRRVAEIPSGDTTGDIHRFLTPRRILDLARHALRLEKEFGAPQDIEWSIDAAGELWILQSRPITTVNGHEDNRVTAVWSNANVNENFPEPISPLLYSIASTGYYHYFRNLGLAFGVSRWRLDAMEQPLRGIVGVHGGRLYYNLTNIHSVLRMAPFGESLARAFNQFVGATEVTPHRNGALKWSDARNQITAAGELLRIAGHTLWQYAGMRRRLEAFERTADAFAARTHPDRLQTQALPELLNELRAFLEIRNHRWKNASLADAGSMLCYALLQHSLKTAGYAQTLHNRLLRALPGVPSVIPPLRLWDLSQLIRADEALRALFADNGAPHVLSAIRRDARFAEFKVQFEQFLEDWGFRSSAELMLTIPSLQEDPIPAIELLKEYAAGEGEAPGKTMAQQAAERLAETSRLLRQLLRRSPLRAITVWVLVRWTQRAVAYRERARLKQALLYTRVRRIALAIGDRFVSRRILSSRDDIFMLSCREIDELGTGRAMFPYGVQALVQLRRRDHAALTAMQPPDTIRLPEGDYLSSAIDAIPAPPVEVCRTDERAAVLQGSGASGGRVDARAAVLGDVRDAGLLQRGEVLVTRQTDPGWAPVFCLISGLVIERGGMLSHGAIIAREFGLPCVVGVHDATRRIGHGTRVTVDGDLGTCTIHD